MKSNRRLNELLTRAQKMSAFEHKDLYIILHEKYGYMISTKEPEDNSHYYHVTPQGVKITSRTNGTV